MEGVDGIREVGATRRTLEDIIHGDEDASPSILRDEPIEMERSQVSSQEGSSVDRTRREGQSDSAFDSVHQCSWDGRAGNLPVWAEDYTKICLKKRATSR